MAYRILAMFLSAASASAWADGSQYQACYDRCYQEAVTAADAAYPGGDEVGTRNHSAWRNLKSTVKNSCLEREDCDGLAPVRPQI